jgi:hypothetical protein
VSFPPLCLLSPQHLYNLDRETYCKGNGDVNVSYRFIYALSELFEILYLFAEINKAFSSPTLLIQVDFHSSSVKNVWFFH